MLKLQEFIKANKNWREQLEAAPYNLKIVEEENLVLFKYNQLNSDFSNPIVCEARGVILEKGTWRVIRIAFNKFFNIEEPNAAKIDWESAYATEKIDGTLISVYNYDNTWHFATNSTINAYNAPLGNGEYESYGQLFAKAAEIMGLDFTKLNRHYTYTFELVSPYNPVVIHYDEIKLYHTLTRNNDTLEEVDVNIGIPKPAHYYLEDEADYKSFVEEMSENHEGIVVQDKYNNRVKIKTQTYFALHHLVANHCITLRKAIFLIWTNEQNELLSYFPEFISYFNQVKTQLDQVKTQLDAIQSEVEELRPQLVGRKDFVRKLGDKDRQQKALYFLALDNKLYNTFSYNPEETDEQTMSKIKKLITTFKLDA